MLVRWVFAADIKHALGFWHEEHAVRSMEKWSRAEEEKLKELIEGLQQDHESSLPGGHPSVRAADLPTWAQEVSAAGLRRNRPERSAEDVACFLHQMNGEATVSMAALLLFARLSSARLAVRVQQICDVLGIVTGWNTLRLHVEIDPRLDPPNEAHAGSAADFGNECIDLIEKGEHVVAYDIKPCKGSTEVCIGWWRSSVVGCSCGSDGSWAAPATKWSELGMFLKGGQPVQEGDGAIGRGIVRVLVRRYYHADTEECIPPEEVERAQDERTHLPAWTGGDRGVWALRSACWLCAVRGQLKRLSESELLDEYRKRTGASQDDLLDVRCCRAFL
jgi:hypothetical protein